MNENDENINTSSDDEGNIMHHEIVHEIDNSDSDLDPRYVNYLQNSMQDEIIDNIFCGIANYVCENALHLCEFMTKDDVEVVIQELL